MNMDMKDKKLGNQNANAENELYFPEYIKAMKGEEDPENINYQGMEMSAEERMEYENDLEKTKADDYGDRYMKEAK